MPARPRRPRTLSVVGTCPPRLEGVAKVAGSARYIDDLESRGLLLGRTVRSTVARGELLGWSMGRRPRGLHVVSAADIPGRNAIALLEPDQPCLVSREIRHAAEPVLLLAHEDRDALASVGVELRERPRKPQLDVRASRSFCKEIRIEKGTLARGFERADRIVEGEYTTGHQEQLYVETQGVIAVPERDGVTIYGSLQCPYYVQKALVELLRLPPERVRIVQVETGGGFGGKEEYPSMIAGHAALLALKSGRPVKLVYDRTEDMLATTKRHPSIVRHKTGVRRDGTLTAMQVDVLLDAGAYVTLSPVVLSRGVLHATGPYRCENVQILGRAALTNTPPNGAFRGFGAPQTQFAVEVHMERIAEALGIDPLDLRRRNALRPGDTTATGQRLGADCSALPCLESAVRRSRFVTRRRAIEKHNAKARIRGGPTRGIGLALFFHGSGFTGAGEVKLASRAALELTPAGARILVASTEIGQGTRTILAQIVAEEFGWPLARIEVADPDTSKVPDSGPTVASRTCMIVGEILRRCAQRMKRTLGRATPRQYLAKHGSLVVTEQYDRPKSMQWDDVHYRGDAYGAYGYGCDVVELEIDPVTAEARPVEVTAVQDIGRAIHPVLAAGQIEGGTAQGIAFALAEEVVMRDGRMANAQLTNYAVPTPLDTPPMNVEILEFPYGHGPFGAKGVGEMPIDGPAPAVVNALRHAGLDIRDIPAVPERIAGLVDSVKGASS